MKVLIVDDEQIVRDGLQKRLREMFPGRLELYGAENGTNALALIRRVQPQVVLTDICMPDMDGLELVRAVRGSGLQTHFIIISGHDDFRYARQAIRYNVTDFLVKPIDEADLFQNFNTLLEKADLEHQKMQSLDDRLRLNRYLKQGVQSGFSEQTAELYPEFQFDLLFPYQYFSVCAVTTRSQTTQQICRQPVHAAFGSTQLRLCCFEYQKHLYLCLISYDRPQQAFPAELLALLKQTLQPGPACAWGTGGMNHGCDSINIAAEEALSAVYLRIYGGNEEVYHYAHQLLRPLSQLNPREFHRKARALIETGNTAQLQYMLRELYGQARNICVNPREYLNFCKHFFFQLHDCLDAPYCDVLRSDLSSLMEQFDDVCKFGSEIDILQSMSRMTADLMSVAAPHPVYSLPVSQMMKYVQENISRPIELKAFAQRTGKSQNYLGAIFKKETGMGFSAFVLQKKMETARETILQQPEVKIYELAAMVGYCDEKYFARIFKAYYGITPGQMKQTQKHVRAENE